MTIVKWSSMLILGLAGALLPAWAYLAMKPVIAQLFNTRVGFGPGILLNLAGHLIIAGVSLIYLYGSFRLKASSNVRTNPV
jgi:hypothetical protein